MTSRPIPLTPSCHLCNDIRFAAGNEPCVCWGDLHSGRRHSGCASAIHPAGAGSHSASPVISSHAGAHKPDLVWLHAHSVCVCVCMCVCVCLWLCPFLSLFLSFSPPPLPLSLCFPSKSERKKQLKSKPFVQHSTKQARTKKHKPSSAIHATHAHTHTHITAA